jgi:hypothetical protein
VSEHRGRNITRQFEARPQLEDLAPCGSPHCAGCYDVGDGRKIHPPRNGYENPPARAGQITKKGG